MRPSHIYTSALALCATAGAWPSFLSPGQILERGAKLLERQASKREFNLSYTGSEGQIATSSATSHATQTSGSQSGSITGSITGSASGSGGNSNSNSNNTSPTTTSYTQTVFDPRQGPGGISMITPNPISGATYYKIKDYVTFGWNYTSVSILPSHIDILAVASNANNVQTFTLATNQSVTGTSQAFTWDTGNYQSTAANQLLTASYTLVVHDAQKDVSATPSAGYLGTWSQFVFAMYTPQAYTPFSGFQCATCSGAMTTIEKQALGMVLGMATITVLSFTWFAGAAGVF